MRIVISGSSGLIGSALAASLSAQGHEIVRLVRRREDADTSTAYWDPAVGAIETSRLEGADAVVHLAGESIATGRWSADKKRRIRDSRVDGTRLLSEALADLDRPPSALVSASAIGYYGDRGDEVLTERSELGRGFLAEVGAEWEAVTGPAKAAGTTSRAATSASKRMPVNAGEIPRQRRRTESGWVIETPWEVCGAGL